MKSTRVVQYNTPACKAGGGGSIRPARSADLAGATYVPPALCSNKIVVERGGQIIACPNAKQIQCMTTWYDVLYLSTTSVLSKNNHNLSNIMLIVILKNNYGI